MVTNGHAIEIFHGDNRGTGGKMTWKKVHLVVLFRIMVTAGIGGVFLPPDSRNPHALGDAILLVFCGLVWAVSDIFLHEKERP
jgi:hypothetical protein